MLNPPLCGLCLDFVHTFALVGFSRASLSNAADSKKSGLQFCELSQHSRHCVHDVQINKFVLLKMCVIYKLWPTEVCYYIQHELLHSRTVGISDLLGSRGWQNQL